MAFDVRRVEPDASQVVGRAEEPFETAASSHNPNFVFDQEGYQFTINGRGFDPNRADDIPAVNTNEVWTLRNPSGGWWLPQRLPRRPRHDGPIRGRVRRQPMIRYGSSTSGGQRGPPGVLRELLARLR